MLIVLELLQQLKGLLQKYGKYSFNQTTVNCWKNKFKVEPVMSCLRKLGDPTLWKAT